MKNSPQPNSYGNRPAYDPNKLGPPIEPEDRKKEGEPVAAPVSAERDSEGLAPVAGEDGAKD